MRFPILALSVIAVLTSSLPGYAQDAAPDATTATAEAPAPVTEPAAEAEPAAAPATAETPAPTPATDTAATIVTEPTDRVVITPQVQETEEGQIDLQALTEEEELPRFVLEGYYRVRGNYLRNLDLDDNTNPSTTKFFQHRLRMEPKLNLNSKVVFKAQVDAMDDRVWGANPGNVLSQSTADREPNLIVKRAWADISLPFGQLSAGRMPSHWGMGLFSNDGNGFRNEFGDAHFGTTFDRIAFGTKPLGVDSNWVVALVYDKIVADQPAALISPENIDPVDEIVGVVLFSTDPLKVGAYQLYRFQDSTDTKINATDIYFKLDLGLLYVETEHVFIYNSETRAVPILNQSNFTVSNPKVEIGQYGYAAKVGLNVDPYGIEMEWGNATGDRNGFNDVDEDSNASAPKVTNYKFHPDYNVGLIMFEYANAIYAQNALETQKSGLATLQGEGIVTEDAIERALSVADLALTNGSVTNAMYLNPKLRFHLGDGTYDITLAYLTASANAPRVILQQAGKQEYTSYGHEFDASLNINFTKNFVFGVQTGFFRPGNYFNRQDFITGYIVRPDNAYLGQGRFTVLF